MNLDETMKRIDARNIQSAVRLELSDYQFKSEKARAGAEKVIAGGIRVDDDGILHAGARGSDIKGYVSDVLRDNPFFLKSGASAQSRNAGILNGREVRTEDIRPGMSKEARAAAYAKVAEIVKEMGGVN